MIMKNAIEERTPAETQRRVMGFVSEKSVMRLTPIKMESLRFLAFSLRLCAKICSLFTQRHFEFQGISPK
jgi:hypothetical protein